LVQVVKKNNLAKTTIVWNKRCKV